MLWTPYSVSATSNSHDLMSHRNHGRPLCWQEIFTSSTITKIIVNNNETWSKNHSFTFFTNNRIQCSCWCWSELRLNALNSYWQLQLFSNSTYFGLQGPLKSRKKKNHGGCCCFCCGTSMSSKVLGCLYTPMIKCVHIFKHDRRSWSLES